MRLLKLIPLPLALLLVLGACGSDDAAPASGELTIVTTTSIWADVVEELTGDAATVITLIPNGADPHEYSPGSRDASTLAEADLIIANGLGLEESLDDLLDAVQDEGATVLRLAEHVDTIGDDPHIWMDPARVADAVAAIGAALEQAAPGEWEDMASAYLSKLDEADDEIQRLLSDLPAERRAMLTNHEALAYFADRYEFEIVGVIIPGGSTLAEPSSADLGALVELMRSRDMKVIFGETSEPDTLAQSLAAEIGPGATVVELHTEALDGPDSGADSLVSMLITNAELISRALSE